MTAAPFLALITPLTGPGPGEHPAQPIYIPGYPDQSLPVGGAPSHPIAGFPDQGLPPGGTPVPPGTINPPLPVPPGALANQIVVAVHRPGQDWEVKAYPVGPAHPIPPAVTPHR